VERNLCLLILFTCSLFSYEDFWFSYKIVTENRVIVYEERNISPHMIETENRKKTFLCKVNIKRKKYQSTKHYLNKNFNKILPCFYPMGTKIVNKTLVEMKGIFERTEMIIIPTKFTVDFNDQFANISLLKQ